MPTVPSRPVCSPPMPSSLAPCAQLTLPPPPQLAHPLRPARSLALYAQIARPLYPACIATLQHHNSPSTRRPSAQRPSPGTQ
ncbi:hypothetical protein ACOSQ2_014104 [Xanthoceras sorbifolium]